MVKSAIFLKFARKSWPKSNKSQFILLDLWCVFVLNHCRRLPCGAGITFKTLNIRMKGLNYLAAFLGGAALGVIGGLLFAPEKGEDTRNRIAEALRKRGIKLSRNEIDDLVDEIASEVKE
jgi:hypothetical protein